MEEFSGYVGLDVHKETIVGAMAYPGRSKPESVGVIANTKRSILSLRTPLIDGTYQQGIANMASSTPIALHDLA